MKPGPQVDENAQASQPSALAGSVLVVDDNPDNLRVLEDFLKAVGCRVRLALSGEIALRSIAAELPGIILLDVRMPGLDGYEVCRRLKANPDTRDIPVIFISALRDIEDKLKVFQAGGVDYVAKPFQAEEVVSRVRAHLALAAAQRTWQELNARLELRVAERTHALAEANALLELGALQERAINELMRISLANTSLRDFLGEALRALNLRLGWQDAEQHNLIFLADRDDPASGMWLAAAEHFSPAEQHACRNIQLGRCHCFRAVMSGQPALHDAQVTDCDTLGRICSRDAARYWLPLVEQGRVLGALVHFLPKQADAMVLDADFLRRLGEILALGVARRLSDERVAYLAFHDQLTDLPNRRMFEGQLARELNRSDRNGRRGAVLFLDLDRFKNVNDVLGHAVGDELLRQVSQRLLAHLRKEDVLARWGGDEFLVMLPDIGRNPMEATQNVTRVAEKLREAVGRPFDIGGNDIRIGVSLGVALYPSAEKSVGDLIQCADTAMYRAKHSGRNSIYFFEQSMQVEAERVLRLERNLRRALASGEFRLHYQPQTDHAGRLIGMEALVRWPQSEGGAISPAEFIPLAEDVGLITPLGEWALREGAAHFARFLRDHDLDPLVTLAVNVSFRQFHGLNFAARVQAVLRETGLPPERLRLEITESVLLGNVDKVAKIMESLGELGVAFAVDDFGTGYSSLAYLKRLPIRLLKIDQSFVRDVHADPHDAAIVSAIVSLARNLDLETLSEGVESAAELEFLEHLGCNYYQGFYFSRPLPWERMEEALKAGCVVPHP